MSTAGAANVLGLPDEGRDALMDAALAEPPRAQAAWRRWLASGGEPSRDPIAVRWLPLIAWNLRDTAIDASTRRLFGDALTRASAINYSVLGVAARALGTLRAAGVRVMLLKGAAAALTLYEAPGLRPIGDVDVLVPIADAARCRALLADAGWRPFRHAAERDLPFCHGIDLVKPPYGRLDLHWYLLHECCWPGADDGVWARAEPFVFDGVAVELPSAADQLLHACVHGLRWSPVHSAHWVADAVRLVAAPGDRLAWDVVVREAERRDLRLQVREALALLDRTRAVAVPPGVLASLARRKPSAGERLEVHCKARPVVSAGGLFVIWCCWRRAVAGARAAGAPRPPWLRFLMASVAQPSLRALLPWGLAHLRARVRSVFRPGRRGTSGQPRLAAAPGATGDPAGNRHRRPQG